MVYRAIQEPLGRTVAIKALKTSAAADSSVVTRFEREAKSLANLQHENIIHVYDFHYERGAMFIVMEYVQGIDLYDLLDRCGRLPYEVAAILAMQVARALDYTHYRGVIHRDIKPANIMIARTGGVKVMDFGIARDTSFRDLTEAGAGIGTPAYMSPEQVLGDKLDARSDIFSLGVVLYQMVTGRKPFIEDEKKSAMHKIRLENHDSARSVNPEIPRELNNIIDRCLEKQPRDRWRSAQHMVIALEHFLAKHVEMNHHARLVLFIKSQGVITELEAEEYLNPVALGAGAGALQQPNLQARNVVRAGIVAHGVTLGVFLLFLALIHVAPLEATPKTTSVGNSNERGYVRIDAHPWAKISIDGASIGYTPIAKAFALTPGRHIVQFQHDRYVPYSEAIDVPSSTADNAMSIVVDLAKKTRPVPEPPSPQVDRH